jgi:hypothetical protein
MGTVSPVIWTVVIPVKVLALAKSRLSGLTGTEREAMALAMAGDTVTTRPFGRRPKLPVRRSLPTTSAPA